MAWLGSSNNDRFGPGVWPNVLGLVLLSDDSISSSIPRWQIWENSGFPGWTAATTTAFARARTCLALALIYYSVHLSTGTLLK